MSTIGATLAAARQKIEANEARLLLRHVLACNAAWIEAHRDDTLDADTEARFGALVARRAAGEPIAYLVGVREFYGRDFFVAPGVLIPRPETELIVDIALRHCEEAKPTRQSNHPGSPRPFGARDDIRVLDLGTGSGCLAITLALELPQAEITAVDVSSEALAIAERNAQRLGAKVRLIRSDWFSSTAGERFDLIVSNPPYIAANDPHLAQGDLRFEPAGALASGSDGLDAIRRIVEDAPHHLAPDGLLLFEHGYDQAEPVRALLEARGLHEIEQHHDLAGIVRVSGGRTAL